MKPRDPKARSLAALQTAMDRQDEAQARPEARGPEPWPGDLYVLAETGGFPVEWLVVERAASGHSGQCLLVAADTNPALGVADVPVPTDSAGGPLSLRCAVSLEVGVEILRRGERTGAVAPDLLDPVRRRLEALAAGALDEESAPDLDDWLHEVLLPARAALLAAGASRVETPTPSRHFGRRAAAAVFLFLLSALAGVSIQAWRFHQGELQARREVERLVHERQAPPPAPLINLAHESFYPDATRGAGGNPREIRVPAAATHLFWVFYVGHQEPCAEYELEIGGPSVPFTVRHLRPLPGKEVSVALPRTQVPDGIYQLRLYGLCGTERRTLGDYEARLKEAGR